MNKETAKPNLLIELARRKVAQKSEGLGILGKDLASQFRSNGKPQPKIRRGGRNGGGKP